MGGLLAIFFVLQTPSEPMRLIKIDEPAFEMALELAECMKDVQSAEREQFRSMDFEARQERIGEACEVDRRNAEIFERLKVVFPGFTQEQLLEEHKKVMVLAISQRFSGSLGGTSTAKSHD